MSLEAYLKIAISKLQNGKANKEEKTLVLANESIGGLKNGGFSYFYNYDFSDGVTHEEVIDAHSAINPEIKILHQGFQNYLSGSFFDKTPDERYEELSGIWDEDGQNPAHVWERRLLVSIRDDFKKLEDWVSANRSAFDGGLMIPRVESRAQAEEIVRYTKFPPMGDRGVILGTAHNAYRAEDGRRFLRQANAELLLIMQIETLAGLEHVEEILSVPGLDVALIGPYDLSTSMGIPGEVNHPRMVRDVDAFLKSCKRHGVVPGNFVTAVEDGRAWLRRGMRFLIYGADFMLLMERSRQVLAALRPKEKSRGPL